MKTLRKVPSCRAYLVLAACVGISAVFLASTSFGRDGVQVPTGPAPRPAWVTNSGGVDAAKIPSRIRIADQGRIIGWVDGGILMSGPDTPPPADGKVQPVIPERYPVTDDDGTLIGHYVPGEGFTPLS